MVSTTCKEKSEIIVDDILDGMFYYLPESRCLPPSQIEIRKKIYEMSPKYSLLKDFVFSTKGINPCSPTLGGAIARSYLSRIIYPSNMDDFRYEIRKEGREYVKNNIIPLFNKEELQQLKNMAQEFNEVCVGYLK